MDRRGIPTPASLQGQNRGVDWRIGRFHGVGTCSSSKHFQILSTGSGSFGSQSISWRIASRGAGTRFCGEKAAFASVANLADRDTQKPRIRPVEKVIPELKGKGRSGIDPEARNFPAKEERQEEVAPSPAGAPARRHRGCEPQPGASLDHPGIDGPGALRFRLLGHDPQEALVDQAAAEDKFALVGQAPGNLPRAERFGPRGKPERRTNEAREEDLLPVK